MSRRGTRPYCADSPSIRNVPTTPQLQPDGHRAILESLYTPRSTTPSSSRLLEQNVPGTPAPLAVNQTPTNRISNILGTQLLTPVWTPVARVPEVLGFAGDVNSGPSHSSSHTFRSTGLNLSYQLVDEKALDEDCKAATEDCQLVPDISWCESRNFKTKRRASPKSGASGQSVVSSTVSDPAAVSSTTAEINLLDESDIWG